TGVAWSVMARAIREARSVYFSWKPRYVTTAPRKSSTYSACAFSRRQASASLRLAKLSVDRSTSSSVRMRSPVAAGAHTPLEKTFLPFFSATTQWSPASFTRRVSAASPGGRRIQPFGTFRTEPSADRTVFGVGPGENRGLLALTGHLPGSETE